MEWTFFFVSARHRKTCALVFTLADAFRIASKGQQPFKQIHTARFGSKRAGISLVRFLIIAIGYGNSFWATLIKSVGNSIENSWVAHNKVLPDESHAQESLCPSNPPFNLWSGHSFLFQLGAEKHVPWCSHLLMHFGLLPKVSNRSSKFTRPDLDQKGQEFHW